MIDHPEKRLIRDLAKRCFEIASSPVMADRRERWHRHNSLQQTRPMVVVFPEGSWGELLPGSAIQCVNEEARSLEWGFRAKIYAFEHFQSDNAFDPWYVVGKTIHHSGWGIEAKWRHSQVAGGARGFDPVINSPADLAKIKHPLVEYDEAATLERANRMRELLADVMPVKVTGIAHLSFHLMSLYTSWRGLERVMLDMYEEPQMLHDAMAILEAGHHQVLAQYAEQNLFSLNNDGTYHSSGGYGWTPELPAPGFDPARVRPRDLWASAEAQELAQVSPDMHEEFSLAYEKRLLAPFALNGYGCCEDLTGKLEQVLGIPNLRRISISPWADIAVCAEKIKGKCILSWKPHPAHLVGHFDPAALRQYFQHAVAAAKANGCVLEMILKDTHTCENHPERFDEWTRIAMAAVQ